MFQKMHYATSIASYHEAHSPYQTEIVVSNANEFMIPAYHTELIGDEVTTLSSRIVHYSITGDILNLTEEGENREVMCMSYSHDGKILGIWGTDTLRIFDSETGNLCKTIKYQVQGDTLGVIYTASGQIVIQVRVEKESISSSVFLHSKWALYLLDQDSGTTSLLLEYVSTQNVLHPKNTPAFDVDVSGRFFVYYSDKKIQLFNLTTMTVNEIWQFSEDSAPVWIKFLDLEASTIAVQWADKLLYLPSSSGKPTLYENCALLDAELCAFTKNKVFFVNEEGGLFLWDLVTNKVSDELIPRVKIEIEEIQQDYSGNLIVRYSNSCILTIDIYRGLLVDTFFSNENDAKIEASLYLNNINRQLIVLRTSEYEQLLLYDNYTGIIQRIDIYSFERLKFVKAHAVENTLFVGFDKKVIAVDLLSMKQADVWSQRAGEVLFDMEIEIEHEQQTVVLLLQWSMLCKRPKYTIMKGAVAKGFIAAGERNVDYIDASHLKKLMIANNDDIRYFGMDAISDQTIYTVRVLGEQNEKATLKRVFMFVKQPSTFLNSTISITDTTYVMQLDENWIVTVRGLVEIGIINNKNENKSVIRIEDPNDPDSHVQILDCFMGQNNKLYCRSAENKLIQVDAVTGILEKTFDFMPGIIVSNCDFTGSEISEKMKQILMQHGAVFR